ncbi:MAG: DUF4065 domain-containing protein [Actinomycetia bacterium]|nr:DUF4065 domain-containing protein [Actinomycetes bacterium]
MKIELSIPDQIIQLRHRNSKTQEEVATELGMSRQSYALIEQGTRDISLEELRKLAAIFGVTLIDFFIQPTDTEKFAQMFLYIVDRMGSVPKTKLAKLLYLADFRNYYETLESMSGAKYICREYGPVANVFFELTDELFDQGKISITPKDRAQIITSNMRNAPTGLLSAEEKLRLDEITDLWKDKLTQEIVHYTHEQKPWRATRDGDYIPYELIIQEDPEHVFAPLT